MRLPLLPRRVRWGLVLGVAGLVAVYSIIPLPTAVRSFGPFGIIRLSQYAHLLAYAGLAGVLVYALVDSRWSSRRVLVVVFVVAVGYGLGLELVQRVLPYRQFDLGDVGVNALGTAVAVVGWRLVFARARLVRVGNRRREGRG